MTISNPEKGVFLDTPNTGAFETGSNKPLAFGVDLENYRAQLPAAHQGKYFTLSDLLGKTGIENGMGWLALEYYIGSTQKWVYPNFVCFPIFGSTFLWIMMLRRYIPAPVLARELEFTGSPPDWFKKLLIRRYL